jgi:hypothetical protein
LGSLKSGEKRQARFTQIDPLAVIEHTMSPYQNAGNNPITFNDPMGLYKASVFSWTMLEELWNSPYGGTWEKSNGIVEPFKSDIDAASWAEDNFKSLGATDPDAHAKLLGIINKTSWLHFKYNYKIRSNNGSNTNFKYTGSGSQAQRCPTCPPGDPPYKEPNPWQSYWNKWGEVKTG